MWQGGNVWFLSSALLSSLTAARVAVWTQSNNVSLVFTRDALPLSPHPSNVPGHQGHIQFVVGMWFPQNSSVTLTFILLRLEMVSGEQFLLSFGRTRRRDGRFQLCSKMLDRLHCFHWFIIISSPCWLPEASYSISLIIFPRIIVKSSWQSGPAFLPCPTINPQTLTPGVFVTDSWRTLSPWVCLCAVLLPGLAFPVPRTLRPDSV